MTKKVLNPKKVLSQVTEREKHLDKEILKTSQIIKHQTKNLMFYIGGYLFIQTIAVLTANLFPEEMIVAITTLYFFPFFLFLAGSILLSKRQLPVHEYLKSLKNRKDDISTRRNIIEDSLDKISYLKKIKKRFPEGEESIREITDVPYFFNLSCKKVIILELSEVEIGISKVEKNLQNYLEKLLKLTDEESIPKIPEKVQEYISKF